MAGLKPGVLFHMPVSLSEMNCSTHHASVTATSNQKIITGMGLAVANAPRMYVGMTLLRVTGT